MPAFLKTLQVTGSNQGTGTGTKWYDSRGEKMASRSPVDGTIIGSVIFTDKKGLDKVVHTAVKAFQIWKSWPAPKRGDIVRQLGIELRENKVALGKLVSYEMGKSIQEGMGEVQEMIDISELAVGMSRQLYGFTMQSERPGHRMYDQYHPLGVVGIISAFNFPVSVFSWNLMIALVCGDVCIWKPSEKTPLSAIAVLNIFYKVLKRNKVPEGVICLVTGGPEIGKLLTADPRIALISATGSTRMGKAIAVTVAARMGRTLLELGGNNAIIISKYANQELALKGALFGAIGTAGQRCTTTRRLIVQEDIYEDFKKKLISAYQQIKIGNPLDEKNLVGPLIDLDAVAVYKRTLKEIEEQGGTMAVKGKVLKGEGYESGCYVKPCIAEVTNDMQVVQTENFVPVLYLIKYKAIEEAIAIQNGVPQGLSSSIFTENLKESELFLSSCGSDCGIANVNIGTSGAEIGGAFGGEKETGGGREAGSDAWKTYMRRQTNTINYSDTMPLSQGITFNI